MIASGFICQIFSVLGWVALAWGVGHAVGATVAGETSAVPILIAAAGALLRAVSGWIAELQLTRAGQAMVSAARGDILDTARRQGASILMGAPSGERVSQIVDRTAKLEGYAARYVPGMRLAVAGPVIVLIAVATQTWLAAVLLLISVLVLPVFIWLTASGTAAEARAQQAALDSLSGTFQSRAVQSGLIRAFRAVGRETAIIAAQARELHRRTMSILRMAFLSTAVLEFFASISIALVAVYVGFKLLGVFPFATGETLTLAEGLTALMLAPEFFAPIRRLSSLHHDRGDAAEASRFLSVWLDSTDTLPPTRTPPLPSAPVIRFDSATLQWPDGRVGASGVNLTAAPSQITALNGPSGSGKSTCLLALLGHVQTATGAITIDGHPLQAGETLADSVAYLSQTPWLMEGTLAENIAIARPDATAEEITSAARAVGLPEDQLRRPLGRRGSGLSGGERQRIALARAILRNAPILLMDEPTAHLDPDAEAEFIALIRTLTAGRTIIIASHSAALTAAADNVVDLTPATEAAHA